MREYRLDMAGGQSASMQGAGFEHACYQTLYSEQRGSLSMHETQMSQQELFQSYRSLLLSIAYRMLGSVMDAEDCVQEVFLQWHDVVAQSPGTTIENPKAFLCTLVTRRCIDQLRSARVQRESYVGLWLPEPLVEAAPSEIPELAESLSMAFLLLLERLSPLERAVFLLRQVFDYDYEEIATFVGKSQENCRQVMHRARHHLTVRRTFSQVSRTQQEQVFTQFLRACRDGDMEGLLRLLSDEIVVHTDGGGRVSTARNPIVGPERAARYLLGIQRKFLYLTEVQSRPALINGQPGLIGYLHADDFLHEWLSTLEGRRPSGAERGGMRETTKQQIELYQHAIKKREPVFALVLTLAGNQIQEIDIVVNPEKLRHIPALSFEEKI
jgi:RNA polymerase sigma-70 factor, ECF subfamily